MKKPININILAKSILGLSLILSGCAVIFVGVAGGFHSPLSASSVSGTPETTVADTHGASLLRAATD